MFFHKKLNVTISLIINSLSVSKLSPCELFIQWSRHGKCGNTKSIPLNESTLIYYNQQFPIVCNFIEMGHRGWRTKLLDISLVMSLNGQKKNLHTWQIDLARIEKSDVIQDLLTVNTPYLGEVQLSTSLYRGVPPPTPMHVANKLQSRAHTLASNEPEHGLGSLRRSARHASAGITAPIAAFGGQFAQELDAECQKLFGSEMAFTDEGNPEFGTNVMDIFQKQPRGTSFITPIAMVTQTLTQRSTGDTPISLYSFYSIVYIFTEMRYNGIQTKTDHIDIAVKMNQMLEFIINRLVNLYSDVLSDPTPENSEDLQVLFENYNDNPFTQYLTDIMLYDFASNANTKAGEKLLDMFSLRDAPFTKSDLFCGAPLTLKDPQSAKELCQDLLLEAPIPSLGYN